MLAGKRTIVHFVAQQRLRMHRRRHVERFVIVIRASDSNEPRVGVGSNHTEKIRQSRPAKAADDVPAFYAYVLRILADNGQRLNLV